MGQGAWITDGLVLLPLAGALLCWLSPLPRVAVGVVALALSLGEVALWAGALARVDFSQGLTVQLEERAEWFGDLGISYHVGLTGFSVWLVGLTAVAMAAGVGYALWAGRERARAYFGLMLFLTAATVGVFVAQDYLLFYVFWEAMLIPLYVLVGVWGGPDRLAATQARHLHHGRIAPHAGRHHRARAPERDLRHGGEPAELERMALSRLRRRLRCQGPALSLPWLAS
ncbi:MAG: hypothetical protein C4305_04110 [Thermoleophilia bacterium]